MRTYHKIQNIFNRETFGNNKLIENDYTNKTVEFLKDIDWVWTEKVDGTNVRVYWDGFKVSLGGRTDKADIPSHLKKKDLKNYFAHLKKKKFLNLYLGKKKLFYLEKDMVLKYKKVEII